MDEIKKIRKEMQVNNLPLSRMIGFSKSGYRKKYPNNEVYFNANVFTMKEKVWYGDLDITIDGAALQKVADSTGHDLYVLREHDGRFENENIKWPDIGKKAVKTYVSAKSKSKFPSITGIIRKMYSKIWNIR